MVSAFWEMTINAFSVSTINNYTVTFFEVSWRSWSFVVTNNILLARNNIYQKISFWNSLLLTKPFQVIRLTSSVGIFLMCAYDIYQSRNFHESWRNHPLTNPNNIRQQCRQLLCLHGEWRRYSVEESFQNNSVGSVVRSKTHLL